MNDILPNPDFPFALKCQFKWSKNIVEERQTPQQILLGAMDEDFCVLCALGIYLQFVLEFHDGQNWEQLFCAPDETPERVKSSIGKIF